MRRRSAKKETPEENVLQGLWRMADYMRTPNLGGLMGYEEGTPGIMIVPRVVAQMMAEQGWTKPKLREFLWENSKIPVEHLRRAGALSWFEIDSNPITRESINTIRGRSRSEPDNIVFIVAGGSHPTHAYWLQGTPAVHGRSYACRRRSTAARRGRSRSGMRWRTVPHLSRKAEGESRK